MYWPMIMFHMLLSSRWEVGASVVPLLMVYWLNLSNHFSKDRITYVDYQGTTILLNMHMYVLMVSWSLMVIRFALQFGGASGAECEWLQHPPYSRCICLTGFPVFLTNPLEPYCSHWVDVISIGLGLITNTKWSTPILVRNHSKQQGDITTKTSSSDQLTCHMAILPDQWVRPS